MDEYFMEVDYLKEKSRKEIEGFALRLQKRIFETTNLVAAVGIARSKTYAKLSSSSDKPKGRTLLLTIDDERTEIWPLDLDEVWGVGQLIMVI